LNRIDDPHYSGVKRELISLLAAEMKKLNDPLSGWFNRIKDVY